MEPQWGIPLSPGKSSTAVHDYDHYDGVRQDWSDLLRVAYNYKATCFAATER